MNNPMQNSNLLRSPSAGPPIAKKQRGGRTPGSIKARSRPASGSASASARRGPPPMGGPPTTSSKEVVDDAIARRRAELRRLQEKARGAMGSGSGSGSANRNSNYRSSATSAASAAPPTTLMPAKEPLSKRTSDIFPSAPKSPSMIPKATSSTMVSKSLKPGPPISATTVTKAELPKNPNLPPETPLAEGIPPTPAIGRRLEFPSGQKATATATAATATGASKPKPPPPVPRQSRSKSPHRAISRSSSSSGRSDNKSKNTLEDATPSIPKSKPGPLRAKSAPPRRPPGPPPSAHPPVAPASGGFQPMAKIKAKRKAKSNRPAPVRPGSMLPTLKTKSPKNEASESDPKPQTKAPPSSGPTKSGPPPTTAETSKSAPTTLDSGPPTSAPPTAASITETPKAQKSVSAVGNGGADTPPSSGSSARRQKLQLMREQAMAASAISKTAKKGPPTTTPAAAVTATATEPPTTATAPSSSSVRPSSTNSFYTASSSGPATAAFAKAIGKDDAHGPPEIPNLNNIAPKDDVTKSPARKSPIKSPSRKAPPTSSMQSAAQARLEDAYQKSEKEKLQALVKIKELEDKLSQVAKENVKKSNTALGQQKFDVQTLLSVAETQGPQAALEWAKTNASSDGMTSSPTKLASRTGFDTGMGATPRKLLPGGHSGQQTAHRRARMAIRALRARPSQHQQQGDPNGNLNESPEATERRLIRKFKEAAKYVSYEFSSELANYIVRKPYGIPTEPIGLFEHVRPPTEKPDAYPRKAHVSDKTTIEVAAIVKADNTPLLVFGVAGIRYQTNPSSRNVPPNWKHFEDVDAEDRPLGHVTYIDGQANEKEYSLDEILEEALLVREQYCGTLTNTALALSDPRQLIQQQQQKPQQQEQHEKPPVAEHTTKPKSKEAPAPAPQKPQQPPPDADIDSGSSDVLVDFLGIVFGFFFNLIYGIFIGTPLRIIRTTIVVMVAAVLIQALHLYLADGYNDWALREFSTSAASTCSSVLASDLSWFSNHHPGIM